MPASQAETRQPQQPQPATGAGAVPQGSPPGLAPAPGALGPREVRTGWAPPYAASVAKGFPPLSFNQLSLRFPPFSSSSSGGHELGRGSAAG